MAIPRFLLVLVTGLLISGSAQAYESASTHAGMTQQAAESQHRLHFWLKQVHGLPLGEYEPIRLDPDRLAPQVRERVRRHLLELDPVHGYRPDAKGFNRALGWIAAGTVLEGMPFSRSRNHFLNPRTGRGLHNATGHGALSFRIRFLDFMDGRGNFGGIWTGANFNLTGTSVLKWARDGHNAYRLQVHHRHRLAALVARTPAARRHHLAMALVTAGALLHLVQEMAVPAHVRNDFVTTYLAQRSNIALDRSSAYEQLVRKMYGRTGIPRVKEPVPTYARFDQFFTNHAHTGLADRTQREFYSLGSLPKARKLRGADTVATILKAVNKEQPYPLPHVGPLRMRESIGQGLYYGTTENPYLFAYRVSPDGHLQFKLDAKCYRATARRLVPRAVQYSAGLLRHLLRGSLVARIAGSRIEIKHLGPTLATGTLHVLWESASGQRIRIRKLPVRRAKAGALLAAVPRIAVPKQARRVVIAFSGKDANGELLVLGTLLTLP